jgi:hypothetical protein
MSVQLLLGIVMLLAALVLAMVDEAYRNPPRQDW